MHPGEPPTVAGEESKPGGKLLACKGVRKQPTACFDVISSASSSSSKSALFKCDLLLANDYLFYKDLEDFRVPSSLASHGTFGFQENLQVALPQGCSEPCPQAHLYFD